MRLKKRAQVSIEYMAVVGITTIVVISLLLISNYYSKEVENTINTNQIDRIAKEIVDTAESMYYFGEPSKTTLKIYIPDRIKNITITQNELNLRVLTPSGETDMFYFSNVPLAGNLSPSHGFHYVKIEAKGGLVWINGT